MTGAWPGSRSGDRRLPSLAQDRGSDQQRKGAGGWRQRVTLESQGIAGQSQSVFGHTPAGTEKALPVFMFPK